MFKTMTTVAMSFCLVAGAAAAAQGCWRPAEAEAEQAIRYQTELMVVSETCHEQTYPRFLHRNRNILAEYQRRMIEHYRRAGAAHPQASLDTYMTRLANEVALRVGTQSVGALCQEKADFLAEADAFDAKKFRGYIVARAAERAAEQRACID
jgi:hypothetical protein